MFPCVEKAFAATINVAAGPKKHQNALSRCYNSPIIDTHNPPICFHWCILMLYAVFDNFHALANPIRQDILRGRAENRRFCVFLTLEIKFLTTYEVSWPLHRRKPFIMTFSIIPRLQGTISTSTGSLNLLPNFNSVWLLTLISNFLSPKLGHI